MKLKIALGIVVLLIIPALIGLFAATQSFSTDRETASTVPIPAPRVDEAIPRPPMHQPIGGDKVTLDEAQRRTPYTIPVPPQSVVGADLVEVWASHEDRPAKSKQVYLIYSNGLKISIGASMEDMDYGDEALLDDNFKGTTVRGIKALGKDPFVKTTSGRYSGEHHWESELVDEPGGHQPVSPDADHARVGRNRRNDARPDLGISTGHACTTSRMIDEP